MVVMRQLSGEENRPRVGGKKGGRREREEGERDRDTEREMHIKHTHSSRNGRVFEAASASDSLSPKQHRFFQPAFCLNCLE